jgi:predicted PurR-regulated permease PerM
LVADEQPENAKTTAVESRPTQVVVPRWLQLVLLPLALLAAWALARAVGGTLLLGLAAAVTALILNPLVEFAQKTHLPGGVRLPRWAALAGVYVVFFAAVAGAVLLLVHPAANQIVTLQHNVPALVRSANSQLADFQTYLDQHNISVQIKNPGQTALATLEGQLLSGRAVSYTRTLVQTTVMASVGLIFIFVLSVYLLVYAPKIGQFVRRAMPAGSGERSDDYPHLIQRAVFEYVRGQLLFSIVMGFGAAIGLWIYGFAGIFAAGKTYALVFGAFFGLMELLPYIGPFIGAAPPILVALFNDPLTAVWVALLFLAIQQLEGHVVAPILFGRSLRMNPLFVIFALAVGFELYGIGGALLALPVAAVIRQTISYLRQHLVLEPWNTPSADTIAQATGLSAPPTQRCWGCNQPYSRKDSYCSNCGKRLGKDPSA